MQFRVLGPVEVAGERRQLRIAGGSQRAVLAALLAVRNGGVVSVDRLVDAVWGETPPASARRSLHSHVSRLRGALALVGRDGGDAVVTEIDGYRLALDGHDLDADRFEAMLAGAREDRVADPERSVRALDAALGLWRGAAFGELAVRETVRGEAARLDALRAAATADRVDGRLVLGEHQAVIGELEAVVAIDPLAERPHGQLMLALYRDGRQADALVLYRRLQRRLGEQLGVHPSPQVQQLHQRILRQDAELATPPRPPVSSPRRGVSARAPDVGESPRESALGANTARLIGRGEDLAAVAALVTTASLVTLTGPGGVGKTSVASRVAADAGAQFDDGVVRCPLAAVADPATVRTALIGALGLTHRGDRSPDETLVATLGTRRMLLVLDSCEHLLPAVAQVVDRIRERCPHVTVLATSREHLRLPDERVWEVMPLPVPRAGADAAEVAEAPSGALLCARARAVEPFFTLTDANAATVAELCRRLDGMPLAIELAAARLRALGPDDLLERIDERFHLLASGSHRDAGRHRSLQAVVESSYTLLTDAEARLFDRLAVFAGPFPLAAAEHVGACASVPAREVAGVLAELVDKSMVVVDRDDGEVRYRLLDTLRAYGARRLDETDAAEHARRAHADYHVRLAETLGPQVRGPDERRALAGIDAAIDDLRLAHHWLTARGDVDGALRLPAALHDDLLFRSRAEVFAWAESALELPGASGHPAHAGALATAARGAMNRGELDRARRAAEAALATADPRSVAALWALYVLTTTALYEGRLDDVLALADRRAALADALGQDYHGAAARVSRTLAHMYRGDAAAAVHAAAQARAAADGSRNHTVRAWALYSSGEALLEKDPRAAAALFEQAIDAARHVDLPFIEGVALVSLASLRGRSGDTGRALELFHETVALWRRLGNYTQQLTTLRNLVELLTHVGADRPAAVLHGAITAGATPSFGAEAQRLTAAWTRLTRRLGPEAADAAERGRRLSPAEMVDTALAELESLLGAA